MKIKNEFYHNALTGLITAKTDWGDNKKSEPNSNKKQKRKTKKRK